MFFISFIIGSYKNEASISKDSKIEISLVWLEVKLRLALNINGSKSSKKYFKMATLILDFRKLILSKSKLNRVNRL